MAQKEYRLTRRERQIMDIIYRLGEATAAEVGKQIPDPPGYSTIRKLLSILEEKGIVRHIERNRRYVFMPTLSKPEAKKSALKHLMQTLFENSAEGVVATLMDISGTNMSEKEFKKLAKLIEQKRKGRD
jgi:predicted transcriptional regulator